MGTEEKRLGAGLKSAVYTADDVKVDRSCKSILKDRVLLAAILKAVVSEYKDVSEEEIAKMYIEAGSICDGVSVSKNLTNSSITGDSEEDVSVNEGTVKYDVIFRASAPIKEVKRSKYKHGSKEKELLINLKIDIEAQNKYDPGYPLTKRSAYYCARMLSAEFDGSAETVQYDKLYKVYSIWICFDVADYLANTITRFKIAKEDLFGQTEISERDYNLMESVMIRLGKDMSPGDSHIIRILNAVFGHDTKSVKDAKLKVLGYSGTSLEKEVDHMMSFSERIRERAEKEGRAEGLAKGIAEGRAEGKTEGRTEMLTMMLNAKKLYRSGHSFADIEKETGLTQEEIEELLL